MAADSIWTLRTALAAATAEREFAARPELFQRFGEAGRRKAVQDAEYHLAFLARALELGRHELFAWYTGWVKTVLASRGVPGDVLVAHLRHMAAAIREALPGERSTEAVRCIETASESVASAPEDMPEFLEGAPKLAHDYLAALLASDKKRAVELALDAVSRGLAVEELYLRVLQPVMHEVGRLWQLNRISVAQEHFCSSATQLVMSQLYPYIASTRVGPRSLVAASVGGDPHEIGARMVSELFEIEGWNSLYIGANTPTPDLVRIVASQRADLLAVSCSYAPNLGELKSLIAAVRSNPATAHVKVLVGGFVFNMLPDLWKQVGADGFGRDASEALAAAHRIVPLP